MTREKHERVFCLLTRLAMTALSGVSFYIFGEVIIMSSSAEAFAKKGGAVIPSVESVIIAVAVYLIFAFIAIKLRPE